MVAPAVLLFDYFIHDHGIEHFGSKYPEHTVYAYDILVITSCYSPHRWQEPIAKVLVPLGLCSREKYRNGPMVEHRSPSDGGLRPPSF